MVETLQPILHFAMCPQIRSRRSPSEEPMIDITIIDDPKWAQTQ